MARKSKTQILDTQFAFYAQLWEFYVHNRGKIRSRYNGLTKKFLDYNDRTENPKAFLRTPQFEALEMYVFIKEFTDNAQVYELFQEWRNGTGHFDAASYYAVDEKGQLNLFKNASEPVLDALFAQMKQYKEAYPNYIYALTMGLGKTVLMATCIFYEFLLANKYPKDKRFCHNALVFAPDKTVLRSLLEIQTFDKSKVVPPEYVHVLDQNITFHYMDDATILAILDDSEFNIIISNTQKIIVKKKHKEAGPAEKLYDSDLLANLYGDDDGEDVHDEASLIENMRFKRLCRLNQLGVYVDEAHHLFGADLEKQIRAGAADKTSLRNTINMLDEKTHIVACYNYTGTPYVGGRHLPEVVYAYGLKESIDNNYLKNADPHGYHNVKSEEFLRDVIKLFWERYGGKTYEGLNPKLAIYASRIDEAVDVVKPFIEDVLADLGISLDKILVNVGDSKYTKDEDIQNFQNLDVIGSQGNEKQFIILVEKGKEGWNCRSLFGVAMFRKPNSTVFVLQATMRCLRSITEQRQTASIYLSEENLQILDDELNKNFNIRVDDLKGMKAQGRPYHVHVLLPNEKIQLKRIRHRHFFAMRDDIQPVDFGLSSLDMEAYNSTRTIRHGLAEGARSTTEIINDVKEKFHYSELTLTGEVARYLNISCIKANEILRTSKDGIEAVLEKVNFDNKILYDVIIPKIIKAMFEIKTEIITETQELTLLHKPAGQDFYLFNGKDGLVVTANGVDAKLLAKSFHADTYCFDSKPELVCFQKYLQSNKVKKVYFTGMFTSPSQSDFSIPYLNPESNCIRHYYPDFLAEMEDGSYQIVEVKGDDKIDDKVVLAKQQAATEMAGASQMEYRMLAGSVIMNSNVIDGNLSEQLPLPTV